VIQLRRKSRTLKVNKPNIKRKARPFYLQKPKNGLAYPTL